MACKKCGEYRAEAKRLKRFYKDKDNEIMSLNAKLDNIRWALSDIGVKTNGC